MRLRAGPLCVCLFAAVNLLRSHPAWAVPSYASQTGYACGICHTTAFGPQLTTLGQQFKLNGYVWSQGTSKAPPLAAYVITSFTRTQTPQPGGAAPNFNPNDNTAPDQASVFFAGKIADHVGAFVQGTYDGVARLFHWDNLDIRYASKAELLGTNIVFGASLNNNPTVQDLWNSTPAWAYPFVSSALAPRPAAAPILEGGLAQRVYGLSAYAMLADLVYIELGGYRQVPGHLQDALGVDPANTDTLRGIAPYWRLALRPSLGGMDLSLGTFGLSGRTQPGGDGSAGTDRFLDLGYDATLQYPLGEAHSVNANLTYLHELQRRGASVGLGAAAAPRNQLNTLRFNAGYVFEQTWSVSGGPFLIHGGPDRSAFAPAPISGSATGSPNSRGYLGQIEFVPFGKADSWLRPYLNARLGLQYTYYTQFNGGATNFDGSGRSAHGNNTLYLFLWLAV